MRHLVSMYARSALLLMLCAPLLACGETVVWTGRRCPDGQLVCIDAGEMSFPDVRMDAGARDPLADCGCLDASGDAASGELDASSRCVPGHYQGIMEVTYTPGAAGACGLFNLYSGSGTGNLRFTLAAEGADGFAAVASNDCVLGTVDLLYEAGVDGGGGGEAGRVDAGTSPLPGVMTGSVDCQSGALVALMKSHYRSVNLCTLGILQDDYFMLGRLTATYDPATQSFIDGMIELREPPAAFGEPPGGRGIFRVTRSGPPLAPIDEPDKSCFGGLRFPDEKFPDAGW